MNKEEMADHMADMVQNEFGLREAGQKEYAHIDINAFANFERIGSALNLKPEEVLWVFFLKHVDGITAFILGHKDQRESIHGRIADARVYLALLDGMIADQEATNSSKELYEEVFGDQRNI